MYCTKIQLQYSGLGSSDSRGKLRYTYTSMKHQKTAVTLFDAHRVIFAGRGFGGVDVSTLFPLTLF